LEDAMAVKKDPPFVCHVFVCTTDRQGKKRSCADFDSKLIRKMLKEEIGERGWKGRVRVSQSGCLGFCAEGPNVMIYPQNVWFSEVSADDVRLIISSVEKILSDAL
jgi:(2Fe-2S) ferredoxin